MKRLITILLIACMSVGAWARGERKTVVFDVDVHCQGCITKIEKNIAFEKGVKDLLCSLEDKTVTIVYDPEKTDVKRLQEAFAKINKKATVRSENEEKRSENKEVRSEK